MKRNQFWFYSFMAIPTGPEALDRFFHRYETLQAAAREEERHWAEVLDREKLNTEEFSRFRLSSRKVLDEHPGEIPPDHRVEWALRLGVKSAPFLLSDLRKIYEPRLLDAGLWLYFRRQLPDLFSESIAWMALRREFQAFFESCGPERRAGLFNQKHADWWRWLNGEERKLGFIRDWRLRAFLRVQDALRLPESETPHVVTQLLEARNELGRAPTLEADEQRGFDRRALHILETRLGFKLALIDALSKPDARHPEAQSALLEAVAAKAQAQHQLELAAEALARVRLRLPEEEESSDRSLAQAELELRAGRVSQAQKLLLNFAKGHGARDPLWPRVEGDLAEAAVREAGEQKGAARRHALEWAAEYYRRALEGGGLNHQRRRQWLVAYARVLETLEFWTEAAELYGAQARGLERVDDRFNAFRQASDALEKGLSPQRGAEGRKNFPLWLQNLMEMASLKPRDLGLRERLQRARAWQKTLGLLGDAVTQATFNEIEGKVRF